MRMSTMQKGIACGLAAWLIGSALDAAGPAGPLTGQVVDENGRPLPGVKVMVTGGTEDSVLTSVLTDADGRFSFDGQLRNALGIVVGVKEGRCLDWDGSFQTSAAESKLRLGATAVIEGVIVNDAGNPVAAACVRASLHVESPKARGIDYKSAGGTLTVKTDEQGRFRLANLPAAALVQFDMSAPGFAWSHATGPFVPGQKGLRFVLPPEGRLAGVVVEKATGRPLTGLNLSIVGSGNGETDFGEAKTDAEGRFSAAGLAEGSYEIKIVGPAVPEPVVVGNTAFIARGLPEWTILQPKIRVEAGTAAQITAEAVRGGTAELELTDRATGKPIAFPAVPLVISMEERSHRIPQPGTATKDGVAKLYLAPGEYVVDDVLAPGYYYDSWHAWRDMRFRVEKDQTTRSSVIVRAMPRVTGVVRDPAGKPVANASIRILPFRGLGKDVAADGEGRFSIEPADQSGPCFHVFVRDPQRSLMATAVVEVLDLSPEKQRLADKGVPILHAGRGDVKVQPPLTLTGVVRDPAGRAIAGATLHAKIVVHLGEYEPRGESDIVTTARTDKDGKYQMPLGAILARDSDYLFSAMAPDHGIAEVQMTCVELSRGVVTFKMRDELGPGAQIEKDFVLNLANLRAPRRRERRARQVGTRRRCQG